MNTQRIERVNSLIKQEISYIVQNLKDPRLGFITITGVEVSPDLKCAKIFFSILGTENEKKEALKILASASKYMRGELAGKVRLRHLPALNFIFDESIERGSKILELLNQIASKREKNGKN